MEELYQTTEAARFLGITSDWVRKLERIGKIKAYKTTTGTRLFSKSELEAVKRKRDSKKDKKS